MPPTDSSPLALAIDLGASSGRVIAGNWQNDRLGIEEVHRFPNGGVLANGQLMWNWLGLWQGVVDGLTLAGSKFGARVQSLGVDTWGVDFALLSRDGQLIHPPTHHRDARTRGMMEKLFEIVPREEVFAATGLQFLEINTLFQLFAMRQQNSVALEQADRLLMMPDLFHWLLAGELSNERTDASTSQMLDPQTGEWARALVDKTGLPSKILGPLAEPGTQLGGLQDGLRRQTGLASAQVILPPAHDTAAAVAAVPARSDSRWAFISSGTWSCMGVELPAPQLTSAVSRYNFTNEVGIQRTTRLLKNITGMWLLQQSQQSWARADGQAVEWDQLVQQAAQAEPGRSIIYPDHPDFVAPHDMVAAIQDFTRRTQQPVPADPGAVARCCLESIALRYHQVLGWLEEITGHRLDTIHIIGGGSQNTLLNQLTADITQRVVVAGPVEATALGNLATQFISLGILGSIAQAREVIGRSFSVETFEPSTRCFDYSAAIARFAEFDSLAG